ncbi:MAG: hypothetical protein ACLFSL_00160 [Candidatus Woesearchaeota archaeon]
MRKMHSQTGIIIILLLGMVIGGAHGFYAANSSAKIQTFSGDELCNGPYIEEKISAEEGETILLNYKSKITRGKTKIRIIDPEEAVVYEREDSKPIFRQHSVIAEESGEWTFQLDCERAEIVYDIKFKVKDDEENDDQE